MKFERGTRLLEWITALENTDSGLLMLTNVLFALRTKRPSGEILRQLFIAVIRRWTIDGGNRADTIVELIADELLANAMCAAPKAPCTRCSRGRRGHSGHAQPSLLPSTKARVPPCDS